MAIASRSRTEPVAAAGDRRQTDQAGVSGKNRRAQDRTPERPAQTWVGVTAPAHPCHAETTASGRVHRRVPLTFHSTELRHDHCRQRSHTRFPLKRLRDAAIHTAHGLLSRIPRHGVTAVTARPCLWPDLCASALLVTLAACAGTAASDLSLPAELTPAAASSSQRLAARGVQIYECRAAVEPHSPASWTLVAPEAELFDSEGKRVGRHFAGPHWEADDGSRILGSVKARADAPQRDAIAWLLLSATSVGPPGRFSRVTQVQRIRTVGGVAPATACTPGAAASLLRVPYSADYVFFSG